MTRWQRTATEAQARNGALEARLAGTPVPGPSEQGLGVTEAFLDASGTLSGWLGMLALERREVGITCYTFDLAEVVTACMGIRGRDLARPARVRILADETHTEANKATGQEFLRAAGRGVEVRVGRGLPLRVAYPRASFDNQRMGEAGGHHAKVMYGSSTKTAFIGSCNFTHSSQCNVELTAKIALSTSGLVQLVQWFDECWSRAVPHCISSSSGPAPSRSPTRARSRGARCNQPSQQ